MDPGVAGIRAVLLLDQIHEGGQHLRPRQRPQSGLVAETYLDGKRIVEADAVSGKEEDAVALHLLPGVPQADAIQGCLNHVGLRWAVRLHVLQRGRADDLPIHGAGGLPVVQIDGSPHLIASGQAMEFPDRDPHLGLIRPMPRIGIESLRVQVGEHVLEMLVDASADERQPCGAALARPARQLRRKAMHAVGAQFARPDRPLFLAGRVADVVLNQFADLQP